MVDLQEKSIELWREEAWELHGKLRAAETRIKKLEAALREIADCCTLPAQNDFEMRQIARKALEEEK
jgi:hypothetical protein